MLERRLKKWNGELAYRYTCCTALFEQVLKQFLATFPTFTDHSLLHTLSVTNITNQLLREDVEQLSAGEIYIYLMALALHDIGMGCSTDSNFATNYDLPRTFAPIYSYGMMSACVKCAEEMGVTYHVGNLLSSDIFYGDDDTANARWAKMGVMAVEMEGAALHERGPPRQECTGDLHRFQPHHHRRGNHRGGAELLWRDDDPCP